jgi:hypothetical protein
MNHLKIMSGLAVACAFAVSASAGATKGGMKTLTGCLQKGTEAGTYMLTQRLRADRRRRTRNGS